MLWRLSPGEGLNEVGINCIKAQLLKIKAQMASIWAKRYMLVIVCVCYIIIIQLLFVYEVVVVGQTFRSISSQARQQLSECFFELPFRCFTVYSTMRQTTESVKYRSVVDTAV